MIVLCLATASMETWLKKNRRVGMRRTPLSFSSCYSSTMNTKAGWPRTWSSVPDLQSLVSNPLPLHHHHHHHQHHHHQHQQHHQHHHHHPILRPFPAYEQPYYPLQLVQIYFDTATFDEISRDVKNTIETQISVIGGTMGLFTGFQLNLLLLLL